MKGRFKKAGPGGVLKLRARKSTKVAYDRKGL